MADTQIPSKKGIADAVYTYSCTKNCLGADGNSAGCCKMDQRDYIIGKVHDATEFLQRYRESVDKNATYEEVFIEFEEGKKLFPDRVIWQDPANFPAIRVLMDNERYPCRFLGDNNLCTVHEIRSQTCRNYTCGHVNDLLQRLSVNDIQSDPFVDGIRSA